MRDADLNRGLGELDITCRANALIKGHQWGCKCPEKKLWHSIIAAQVRMNKLIERLEKAEKKKQSRINCGVNPPCVKQSPPSP